MRRDKFLTEWAQHTVGNACLSVLPLSYLQVFGANTDVGKTVITAGLLRAAALQVRPVHGEESTATNG